MREDVRDGVHNVKSKTDPLDNTTRWVCDDLNRVIERVPGCHCMPMPPPQQRLLGRTRRIYPADDRMLADEVRRGHCRVGSVDRLIPRHAATMLMHVYDHRHGHGPLQLLDDLSGSRAFHNYVNRPLVD